LSASSQVQSSRAKRKLTPRRYSVETVCNRGTYTLPHGVTVLEVRYVGREYPHPLVIFEVPRGLSFWRVYSMDGPPQTRAEVRRMLASAHRCFHRPFWYQDGDDLILSYPTPNDGELLVVEVIDAQETRTPAAA
jgi:hypothetical protein